MSEPADALGDTEDAKFPDGDGRVAVRLTVNGAPREFRVSPTGTLLDALRDELDLHGARSGCGVGMCGACTVVRDGRAVDGCLTFASLCDGADIRTVEGLESPQGELSTVQKAFLRHRAFQCSYCTSGFLLALEAHLASESNPTEDSIREAFTGHICRCGSYSRIMAAARDAAGLAANPHGEPGPEEQS